MKTKLQYALELADKGFWVFRLRENSKLPHAKGWQMEATRDPIKLTEMFDGKDYNIGIFTSKFNADKALVVIDEDNKGSKRGADTLFQLDFSGSAIPLTRVQTTPTGGRHHIYICEEPLKQGANVLGDGLDIRSRGGYIVSAGSTIDGKPYTTTNISPVTAPEWLVSRLVVAIPKEKKEVDVSKIDPERALVRAQKYLGNAPIAEEGSRNDTAFKVACKIKDQGVTEDVCLELVMEWNEDNEPPLEQEEIETLVSSAYKTGQNAVGCMATEVIFEPFVTGEVDFEVMVERLAALPPLEYEGVRKEGAKKLKCRAEVLDKEVKKVRQSRAEERSVSALMFPEIEPWPHPVNGAELLNEIYSTVKRFIVCNDETARTVTLWIAFTWFIDRVQVAPLAIITAPEKRCGKSQLLALIGMLARRALVASNISAAAIFRVVEAHSPTLLIDEVDSFLRENEEARGIINSGHTRPTAFVLRVVGEDHEPKQFMTWGAKVLCGIGKLSETLMDRAVMLELRRKLPHERVERLRHVDSAFFKALTRKLARFAGDAGAAIESSRPALPDALNDRAQDNWEPLLAIADHAGGAWPELARRAALNLSGTENEAISHSAELLTDIREVFDAKTSDRITTKDLLSALNSDDMKPWSTYNRGKPMMPR